MKTYSSEVSAVEVLQEHAKTWNSGTNDVELHLNFGEDCGERGAESWRVWAGCSLRHVVESKHRYGEQPGGQV